MAKFEEVLPALRAGRKVRRNSWRKHSDYTFFSIDDLDNGTELGGLLADDWEIVPKSKRVALYWIPFDALLSAIGYREQYEVGKQPADAVLMPNSEREVSE